jgi:hypothetical protein
VPLTLPTLDDRRYQDLLNEALARIPVHNPEWTNFNDSDPGVTLVQVFAFLTESLLYRSNQIPERNRRKFLQLLGVPLQAASSAKGLVTFTNERGPLATVTLNAGLEVRAGQVPFRTELGLDVLPIEGQVYYKRKLDQPDDQTRAYYEQLYASFGSSAPPQLQLYQTTALVAPGSSGVDLGQDTADGSLWVALMVRASDAPPFDQRVADAREAIGGKTISLGIVPILSAGRRQLTPGGTADPESVDLLHYQIPKLPPGGALPDQPADRVAQYESLDARATTDLLAEPGVVQITLPPAPRLALWSNLDPLESGVGDFPPALPDTAAEQRIITWLRIRPSSDLRRMSSTAARVKLLWVGINTVEITQRAHIAGEALPSGTGEPDQTATLVHTPVVEDSLVLTVTVPNGQPEIWQPIDDLNSAGPEVPAPDLRQAPGVTQLRNPLVNVYVLDAEAGTVRFGNGARGRRPPLGATLRADYDFGVGPAGNVGPGAISTGPALPAGIKVANPVRTWGGAPSETVEDGERQIPAFLQHRDRLVTAADFESVTRRAPGVDIGRVEVVAAFNPQLAPNEPGDAPGAVTVMLIPAYDAQHPDAPVPDQLFLNTVADFLDARRLVTTEVFVCPPIYVPIWISVGLDVVAGASIAQVREAVKQALLAALSPLPDPTGASTGWPLRKSVVDLELGAIANRVAGVRFVNGVLLAEDASLPAPSVDISGLELPRVAGISVVVGDPIAIDQLRGDSPGAARPSLLPVPVIPEECR